MEEFRFDFEKLSVYQRALNFTNKVFGISAGFPQTLQYSLGDQFRRAALSICNNIAEGSGKQTKNAKAQSYGYSMDSARECLPMINIAFQQGRITKLEHDYFRQECKEICNMIGGLISAAKYKT